MRVSSNTPALSRRSVMKGLACGLAGASVPVAAIAGITASRLSRDAPIIEKCSRWKQRREELDAKERQLRILDDAAHAAAPKVPAELFETIRVRGNFVMSPFNAPFERELPWTKRRLGLVLRTNFGGGASDECRAHVHRLMCLIDKHAAEKKAAWFAYRNLQRQWTRQLSKNDQLLSDIMAMEAQTLQGVAAQIELLQVDESFSDMGAGSERADDIMSNVRRLIAALLAEA